MRILFIFTVILYSYGQDLVETNATKIMKDVELSDKKLVFINFWATWCSPCKKEMPDIIKLSKKYRKSLTLMLVSMDFKNEKNKAKRFLKKLDFRGNSYINTEDINSFLKKMPEEWSGAIPFSLIISNKGKILESITGEKSFEDFEKYIKKHI